MPLAGKTVAREELVCCKEIVFEDRNAEDVSGCGEPNVDHAARDSEGLASSSQSMHENITPETEENGNDSNGDEPHDDDFWPKDLLRFAWQIARGMVNNAVFIVSLEHRLIICIR